MPGRENGHLKAVLAANIDAAITAKGLSVAELSRRTGFHERAIRRWKKAGAVPALAHLELLASELGQDVSWFYVDRM